MQSGQNPNRVLNAAELRVDAQGGFLPLRTEAGRPSGTMAASIVEIARATARREADQPSLRRWRSAHPRRVARVHRRW